MLHRLVSVTIGVREVQPVIDYYRDFGLTETGGGRFATVDGGEQLRIVAADRRRVLDLVVGADDADDIARVAAQLRRLDLPFTQEADRVTVHDSGTDVDVSVAVAPRLTVPPASPAPTNGPGFTTRTHARADAVLRDGRVTPRKLGHVVLGSTDLEASQRLFTDGIGFKVSDSVRGLAAFLRCSTDHHNLLVQPAPVPLLHHTSWQVEDVDEVGRGASSMLAADPQRHVWGLGRHFIGSNFFWYLKDPAGNFSEYYADLDCIVDDQLWEPGVWEGAKSLYAWGPPPPPSFLRPDDLAELMAAAHA